MRDLLVKAAFAASLGLVAYFAGVVLGVRSGVLDFRFGFAVLGVTVGPILVLGCLVLGALALVGALAIPPRQGVGLGLAAFGIPAVAVALLLGVRAQAAQAPPIHDISTDLANPPAFSSAVHAARAAIAGGNDLDLATKRVPQLGRFGASEGRLSTELQRERYPDLQPIDAPLPGQFAYDLARNTAEELGWRITRADPAGLTIEAQVRSFWFGFVDDIVVRVTPVSEAQSRIDVRSVSRVGVSDLGANAKRIRAFRDSVNARLERAGAAKTAG